MDLSDEAHPAIPDWPEADIIVGNPPFLGGKLLRRHLGDEYVDKLFAAWDRQVAHESDLCCYWFEQGRRAIVASRPRGARDRTRTGGQPASTLGEASVERVVHGGTSPQSLGTLTPHPARPKMRSTLDSRGRPVTSAFTTRGVVLSGEIGLFRSGCYDGREGSMSGGPGEVRFAVIGLSHAHIISMVQALSGVRGVVCRGFCPEDSPVARGFAGLFPDQPRRSRDDLLGDPAIDLILCADVNGLRGSLLVSALKAGKHVFVDKPAVTTLEDLDAVERALEKSGKLFFVYFGERLGNPLSLKARQTLREGRIGRTVNFVGLGPHKLSIEHRPAWMFDPALYGGILNDIAIHQVELFGWLTGERVARFRSRVGNFGTPQHPTFEDFGDVWFEGDGGTAGYVRVDWFTPDALPTWGDIRQLLIGTEGTLEVRSTISIGSADAKPALFLTTRSSAPEEVDVSDVDTAWAPQLVADIREGVNRLMPHRETFGALRTVLEMQREAERIGPRP